jgi:Mg-chelatase subunit ChlD
MAIGLKTINNDRGAVLALFCVLLPVLLGFTALGYQVGYWYLVRSELSKAVDAGALSGAANISNPHVDPVRLAEEFSYENFRSGYLGTPADGHGAVEFNAQMLADNRVEVDGKTSAFAGLAQLFGIESVATRSTGIAQERQLEIMLLLDRSGSMHGKPMRDLRRAANQFVSFFEDTQDLDKMGLISFATSVTVDHPLDNYFVSAIRLAIDNMNSVGATNMEDALNQADGPSGFADQSEIPLERRIQQYLVVFSDGNPTAFRGDFRHRGTTYDAVACVTGNCVPGDSYDVYGNLGRPTIVNSWFGFDPLPTGNGIERCGGNWTTKWFIFESLPVPGYSAEQGCIPEQDIHDHVCNLAKNLSIENAEELKNRNIKIYAIGLGQVNQDFLGAISSGVNYTYYTSNSDDLLAIFQEIARKIKLRLVQ